MMFRLEPMDKGTVPATQRCTLQFLAQVLKLKPKELNQFEALGVGEGLECGTVKVFRIA